MKNTETLSNNQSQAALYAKTAYEAAKETFSQSTWAESLKSLSDLVQDDEMRHILRDPQITRSDLKDMFLPLLQKAAATDEEIGFIMTLIEKKHLFLAPQIYHDFVQLQRLEKGLRNVNLTSAEALDEKQIARLEGYLKERFNIRAENITVTIDSSLLGGVIIRMEDRVIDQSLRGKNPQRTR